MQISMDIIQLRVSGKAEKHRGKGVATLVGLWVATADISCTGRLKNIENIDAADGFVVHVVRCQADAGFELMAPEDVGVIGAVLRDIGIASAATADEVAVIEVVTAANADRRSKRSIDAANIMIVEVRRECSVLKEVSLSVQRGGGESGPLHTAEGDLYQSFVKGMSPVPGKVVSIDGIGVGVAGDSIGRNLVLPFSGVTEEDAIARPKLLIDADGKLIGVGSFRSIVLTVIARDADVLRRRIESFCIIDHILIDKAGR